MLRRDQRHREEPEEAAAAGRKWAPSAMQPAAPADAYSQQEPLVVYDSMSTILEVDSEGSEPASSLELAGGDGGGLRVRTGGSGLGAQQQQQQQPVSPVGRETLGGSLSALALQVERLRRSSNSNQEQEEEQEAASRTAGAAAGAGEPLVMITLSPPVEERQKEQEEAHLVEVSNKSTVTAIDLQLMDQLVERFFVQRHEKATQSIEFDCEGPSRAGRKQQWLGARKVETRSVAVNTDKLEAERSSQSVQQPAPSTSTRATQTNSTLDRQDIGTSETRRFKLNHLQIQPVKRLSRVSQDAPEERPEKRSAEEAPAPPLQLAPSPAADSLSGWPTTNGDSNKPKKESSQDSLNEAQVNDGSSSNSADSLKVAAEEQPEELVEVERKEQQVCKQPIPSVKTELRVVIELKDSRRRQVSELKSSSHLNSQRLARSTELSNRRYVTSSPNQVLERLQLTGQRHSLMMGDRTSGGGRLQAAPPPGAVLAAAQQALRSASASPGAHLAPPTAPKWRQVSESQVRNRIEAPAPLLGGQVSARLSSEAQVSGSEARLGLSQRALRRSRLPDGSHAERTLVESRASFDEGAAAATNEAAAAAAAKTLASEPRLVHGFEREEPRRPRSAADQRSTADAASPHQQLPASEQHPSPQPPPLAQPAQQLDIREEREERRQLSRNGRLVFDDRLRERHFERRQSPVQGGGHFRSSSQQHQRTPTPNQQQQQQVHQVHPMQTNGSQLSSDPETMDSGLGLARSGLGGSGPLQVQTGAGAAAPARRWSPLQTASGRRRQAAAGSRLERQLADSGESLNFVDDDPNDDRLVEGLAAPVAGARASPPPVLAAATPELQHNSSQSAAERAASLLIEPPAAFSCSNLDRLHLDSSEPPPPPVVASGGAQLDTRLTRTRRLAGAPASRDTRTRTSLEQRLAGGQGGPAHFRSQVNFESDTDSNSVAACSSGGGKKELVTETRFEARRPSAHRKPAAPGATWEEQGPLWNYSLRVDRMRGAKLEGRADTYIRHSLINSQASA